MKVKKRDGKLEIFDKNKIIRCCKKVGVKEALAKDIASIVETEIYDGITTTEIRAFVLKELERKDSKAAVNFRNYKK